MIIMPYYQRYTEFTLQMRLTLATLAEIRILTINRFITAESRHERLATMDAPPAVLAQCLTDCERILGTLAEIDQAILDIYIAHGRVN